RAIEPRRPVTVSIRRNEKDCGARKTLHERIEVFLGGSIDPVRVLDCKDGRTALAAFYSKLSQRVQRACLNDFGRQSLNSTHGSLHSQKIEKVGNHAV